MGFERELLAAGASALSSMQLPSSSVTSADWADRASACKVGFSASRVCHHSTAAALCSTWAVDLTSPRSSARPTEVALRLVLLRDAVALIFSDWPE